VTRKLLVPLDAGGNKHINLANGTASSDAATFGQIPTALPPNGTAGGDLSGSYPNPTVAQIQGIAITPAQATLVSDLNNAAARSATATLLPGEETVFTGSTASQTLTLPASPPASSLNTITNAASVSVTLAPGSGATLNNFGTTGNVTIPTGYSFGVIYIGTTWYVLSAGPAGYSKTSFTAGVATLTFGTTIAVDASTGNHFRVTLTASTGSMGAPSNPTDGQKITFEIIQDATGSRTMTWNAAFHFPSAGAPTLTTTASKRDLVGFCYSSSASAWLYLGTSLGL